MSIHNAIFGGFNQLGIHDTEAQRAIYQRITGESYLSKMTAQQQEAVLIELRRLGYTPAAATRPNGRRKLDGRYVAKIQSLWIAAYNLGIIRERDDAAMTAFVKRQTGIDSAQWINKYSDAEKVVEALKAWITREGGVDWSDRKPCQPYETRYGYKIALAQHALLKNSGMDGFWPSVTGILDRDITYRDVTDAEWIKVMNTFGKSIRGRKPAPKKKASA
ncbi:regulatory protein GemA [Rhizobium sp. SA279]|uniref:regulatory protein GemA n=1 Tax=Agrobacterium sp. ST15.13.015 TaxID=3017319 RepID=UPI0022C63C91|nr:regulatory protein GemA [Agrobacterium sp. ST15.13.015]MCZ7499351.1 regulatory protein GemA [Rhizobium rhizogenes]